MVLAEPRQGHTFRRTLAVLAATAICAVNMAIVPIAVTSSAALAADPPAPAMTPIDPQNWQDQKNMTWDDYHPIPGQNWADPSLVPSVRSLKIALVAVDFPDQPFVMTMPKHSDPYGNPQIDPIPRADIASFYRNFLLTPSAVNHYQTINGYWMEQSRGQLGVTQIDAYGPYLMPKNLYQYGLNEYNQNSNSPSPPTYPAGSNACPAQSTVSGTQTSVNTVAVGSSAFFYAGDIATFFEHQPVRDQGHCGSSGRHAPDDRHHHAGRECRGRKHQYPRRQRHRPGSGPRDHRRPGRQRRTGGHHRRRRRHRVRHDRFADGRR